MQEAATAAASLLLVPSGAAQMCIRDRHTADQHRTRILRFNTECLRHQRHTREDFIDILSEIDEYERYCQAHPDYKNQRCVHAVKNIGRVYDALLETGDFLAEGPQ